MNLRQQWQDSRLAFEADGLDEVTVSGRHRVWNPDTYISSAAEESAARRRRVIIEASGFVRLSENRRVELPVIYGNRLAMANSRSFRIRLSSFVYPLEDVVFVWANSPPTVVPVEVAGDLLEGSFRFSEALAGDCIGNYTMGTYSCIDVLVTFEGSSSEGLLRWFIPSIFLVIASWLHFWIHGSWSVPRTISAALPFFFFVAFLVFFPQPSLSHSTSEGFNGVQVWLFFCLILTFCSLLEYFVVICCGVRRSTIRMLNGTVAEDVPLNANRDTIYANAMDIGPSETRCASCKQHAGLDLVSRLLFPVVFLIGTVLLLIIYSL